MEVHNLYIIHTVQIHFLFLNIEIYILLKVACGAENGKGAAS